MSKSKVNDAVETIVVHKANKMIKSKGYEDHIQNVLRDHHIEVTKEAMKIFKMGGVDAMIYDVGSALGFIKNTPELNDWTSWDKRREMLKKIFPET